MKELHPLINYSVPASIVVGGGARHELARHLRQLSVNRALIVTDDFVARSDSFGEMWDSLRASGIEPFVFSGVQPDPSTENVYSGLSLYHESRAEGIVAMGGGSPIDAAKAISILTMNTEPLSAFQGYHKIPCPGVPLVAIPTTAGTGSEMSKVTVITDTDRGIKMMLFDPHLLPSVALVDYELTLSMPPALTAHVGLDTLTHGIEAFVSHKANPMSDTSALSCVELVSRHLVQAWEKPADTGAREGMMLAASLGGIAFSNSSVALVHGMSRPLGALFHVPHGLSNAMLLPTVTRYSVPGATSRYAKIARTMQFCSVDSKDEEAAHALVVGIAELCQHLEVPRLRDCQGIERDRFESLAPKMATDAIASGSPANNPVIPSAADIIQLYEEAW